MHNDHGQFDTRSPLKSADFGVRAKPKWPLLAAAGLGGAVVGWFIPLGLIESVTTATGLSEMIPALAPPLGSTMRMLLALGGGVSTLALAAMFLGGRPKSSVRDAIRKPRVVGDPRSVPEGVRMEPNARPDFDTDYSDSTQQFQRDNGEKPMARPANVRKNVRDFDANEVHTDGQEAGGFFSRVKQSLSKLPLPRRFEEEGDSGGTIRDFSDLKRLRPGGEDRRDSVTARVEMPVRPIAAHAELGEPLPPLNLEPTSLAMPNGQIDHGDDLAELERSARAAGDRFAAAHPQPKASPLEPASTQMEQTQPAPEPVAQSTVAQVLDVATAPVSYDAEGIDALVARLEKALAHVRPVAVATAASSESELDLTAYSDAQRLADEAEALRAAEEARIIEERRAEEARQAQLAADAEAKRRADALAAQDAARKAAEDADRAAEEARRRAEEAQALLASLGVEQVAPMPQSIAPAPTPLRAVEQTAHTAAEPEMDDALRSALRTLRRMSNP